MHTSGPAAPTTLEYLPTSQETQASLLGLEYFPAGHAWHDAELYDPIEVVIFPLGHETHPWNPDASLYVPNGHCRQAVGEVPAEAAYLPLSHWLHSEEPSYEYAPAPHDTQVLIDVADGAGE